MMINKLIRYLDSQIEWSLGHSGGTDDMSFAGECGVHRATLKGIQKELVNIKKMGDKRDVYVTQLELHIDKLEEELMKSDPA